MASSHDDVYEKYDCRGNSLWSRHNIILFADGGNFLLGFSRVFSFLILFVLNRYNQTLLRKKDQENTNIIPSLILPYYLNYFKLFIALSFVAGVIDIAFQLSNFDDGHVNNWLIPIEQGLFHWLYEGLAFFLLRYGAGFKAMSHSLFYSGIWGGITVIIFFILFSMFTMQYGMKPNLQNEFALFLSYDSFLLLFYLTLLIIPEKLLYRRNAIYFYASFNVILYSVFIILGSLLYHKETSAVCPGSVVVFIFVGFLQPLVLFRTLQIDSRYWQGLTPDPRNPMLEVWDHVGIDTAQSMAEQLETIKSNNRKLPILHFGLLDIETNIQYIAGGFSRVYFGKLRNQKVALKILFAMELTPEDVKNFYQEASLLHSLSHPNIVECKGICTMPPALAMVLENCKYGSLYDFLYKPTVDANTKQIDIRSALSGVFASVNLNKRVVSSDERLEMTPSTVRNSSSVVNNPIMTMMTQPVAATSTAIGGRVSLAAFSRSTSYNPSSHSNNDLEQPNRGSGSKRQDRVSTSSSRSSLHSIDIDPNNRDNNNNNNNNIHTRQSRYSRTYESFVNMVSSTFQRSERPSIATITIAHGLSMLKRLQMMRDAVAGIAFLHGRGFLHCDIKSLNFLVDENYRVKLADMGEVRAIHKAASYDRPPTPARNWAPPEIVKRESLASNYTIRSETYAVCIVLTEIATLELPFGELPERVTVREWYEKLVIEKLRPSLPLDLPEELRLMMEKCMDNEPQLRPIPAELLVVLEKCIYRLRKESGEDEEDDSVEDEKSGSSYTT